MKDSSIASDGQNSRDKKREDEMREKSTEKSAWWGKIMKLKAIVLKLTSSAQEKLSNGG